MLAHILDGLRGWQRRLTLILGSMGRATVIMLKSRTMIRTLAGLSGATICAGSEVAFAQRAVTPITEIRFDLAALGEDNAARSSRELSAQRGLERSDAVLTPAVNIVLVRPVGRGSVSVTGQLGYSFYARNDQLNRERISVAANADVPVGPCRVGPSIGLQRRQSDLGDIVFAPGVAVGTAGNAETIQRYGVTLGCGRNPGIQPFIGYSYERADNSNALRERAEYNSNSWRGGLRYSSPAVGDVSLFASRREVELSPLALGGTNDPSYRNEEAGIEFRRDIGTRIRTSATVGYSRVRSDGDVVDEFDGVTWNVELSALIGADLRLTAGTGREVTNSLASDAGYLITKPNRVRLEYAFSDRMRLDAGAQFTDRRYIYGLDVPLGAITDENRRTFDAGLSFDVGRRMNFRIYGGHERRNANGTIFDYRANSIGVSLGIRL